MAKDGRAKNASADIIKNPIKRLKADLRGDTKFTNNALDAIFGNLGTTGRGVSRALNKSQERTLGGINRLAARTRNTAYAKNDQLTQHLTNRYGTGLGTGINQQMVAANRQAKATSLDTVGGQQAAGLLAKGGQLGLKIEQQAAKEAQAGADYAMAAAMQDRATALAEARLTAAEDKRKEEAGQIGTAEDEVRDMAANGRTRGDAMGYVRSLSLRYDLSHKEVAKLEDYVNTLYPEGEGAYVISNIAEAPVDEDGNTLLVTMTDTGKASVREKIVQNPTMSADDIYRNFMATTNTSLYTDEGKPKFTPGYAEEMKHYIEWTVANLRGSEAPKAPTSTGTTGAGSPNAAPPTKGQVSAAQRVARAQAQPGATAGAAGIRASAGGLGGPNAQIGPIPGGEPAQPARQVDIWTLQGPELSAAASQARLIGAAMGRGAGLNVPVAAARLQSFMEAKYGIVVTLDSAAGLINQYA